MENGRNINRNNMQYWKPTFLCRWKPDMKIKNRKIENQFSFRLPVMGSLTAKLKLNVFFFLSG